MSVALSSPCSGQTFRYLTRWWQSLWSWLRRIASVVSFAVKAFTGMEIRESLRKPFQLVRGAIGDPA